MLSALAAPPLESAILGGVALAACAASLACSVDDRQAAALAPGDMSGAGGTSGEAGAQPTQNAIAEPSNGGSERPTTCTIGAVCADASCSRCVAPTAEENASSPGAASDAGALSPSPTDEAPPAPDPTPPEPETPAPSASGRPCPTAAPVAAPGQDLAITEIEFESDGSARVQVQNVGTGLLSLGVNGIELCNGADNCVFLSEDISITLLARNTFTLVIPNTSPAGGELGLFFFNEPEEPAGYAFVAWGAGQSTGSLESSANAETSLWSAGSRAVLEEGDTALVCVGPTNEAASFVSCTP